MLSNHAVKILREMRRNQEWLYWEDIQKRVHGDETTNYLAFRALLDGGYMSATVFEEEVPDYDEYGQVVYPKHYLISDRGIAYLEKLSAQKRARFRSWVALLISLLAMLISAAALVKNW